MSLIRWPSSLLYSFSPTGAQTKELLLPTAFPVLSIRWPRFGPCSASWISTGPARECKSLGRSAWWGSSSWLHSWRTAASTSDPVCRASKHATREVSPSIDYLDESTKLNIQHLYVAYNINTQHKIVIVVVFSPNHARRGVLLARFLPKCLQ